MFWHKVTSSTKEKKEKKIQMVGWWDGGMVGASHKDASL